jgi:2-polyprenyl-3-methyl-5-hydroxy-6-metoxy-1,4-benzoquinol methylase
VTSIKDDRGYNQGFQDSEAMTIRTNRRASYIISQMDLSKSSTVLEIGCGTGQMSYIIASETKFKTVGSDLCAPFIESAKQKYQLLNLSYITLDFNEPKPLEGSRFEYIVGNGILHHLYRDLEETLINLKNLLNPGGKIIFLEPNLLNPYCYLIFNTTDYFRKMANLEPDEMAFTRKFITRKLKQAGYSNIKVEYRDFLLPGTPARLIKPLIGIGNVLEKTPLLKNISQSIFISATT